MIEKIYSRKRIKLPKLKIKINKFWWLIFLVFIVFVISVVSFIVFSYPIFIASCKTSAGSRAVNIVNDEVNKIMSNYTYDDLVSVEKDSQGNVSLMKANTILINKLITSIVKNIQNKIDNSPTTLVCINYGSVSRDYNIKKFWSKI